MYRRDEIPMDKRDDMDRAALKRLATIHIIKFEDIDDDDQSNEYCVKYIP